VQRKFPPVYVGFREAKPLDPNFFSAKNTLDKNNSDVALIYYSFPLVKQLLNGYEQTLGEYLDIPKENIYHFLTWNNIKDRKKFNKAIFIVEPSHEIKKTWLDGPQQIKVIVLVPNTNESTFDPRGLLRQLQFPNIELREDSVYFTTLEYNKNEMYSILPKIKEIIM